MGPTPFYAVLAVATLLTVGMTVPVWWRTRAFGFVLGFFFLYYWTLYGAWNVIRERLGLVDEQRFSYLYYKMFPVYLDDDYLFSLVLYATFIITIQGFVLLYARPARGPVRESDPLELSHPKLLIICGTCMALGYLLIKDALDLTSSLNMSGYAIVPRLTPFWNLYSILNKMAIVPLGIGLTVWASGENARHLRGRNTKASLLGYFGLLATILYLNMRLGNRSTILFAVTAAALFYLANARRVRVATVIAGTLMAVIAVALPGIARDEYKVQQIEEQGLVHGLISAVTESGGSAETVSAHFSLYGAVHHRLQPTYGTSLVSLVASVVPRIIWADRPDDIYTYYTTSVGAAEGQGYTIHHAAAWYLNFGIPGVLIGAVLFAWTWSFLYNRFQRIDYAKSHSRRIASIVGFCSFTAFIPTLVRDGPEGYKAVILECIVFPVFVIIAATLRMSLRNDRPVLAPIVHPTLRTVAGSGN